MGKEKIKKTILLIVTLTAFILVAGALPVSVGISICAATDGDSQGVGGMEVLQLAELNPDFVEFCENPPEPFYGYIPPPMDLSHLDSLQVKPLQAQELSSSFDWRDYGKVTPVKDQGPCGTCWIFGTTSVLESAVLIMGESAYDFSEQSVALCVDRSWTYLYDGADDPCNAGGWGWLASEVFIKKSSVLESCNPYNTTALNCDGLCVCDDCTHVKKVDGYRLATDDGTQIDVIKDAVCNHGPVTMAFFVNWSAFDTVEPWGTIYDYYPCPPLNGAGWHLVSIVGWNDSVPHLNPANAGTGAWIAKNSWGTDWGNDGYFYLAYNSSCVHEIAYLEYKDPVPDEELLYWDEAGFVGAVGYEYSTAAWMANVFTAPNSGDLTHVDFWTTSSNAQYEIYVWDNFFGTELAHQTGNCQELGYYSIPLTYPISVDAGQQVTVGVKMTTPGFDYPIPVEFEITGLVEPPIQPNVCFIRYNASCPWTDLADSGDNACLRARLQTKEQAAPGITFFVPPSQVSATVGNWTVFSVRVNQTVNISWYLNGTLLPGTNESVTDASYRLQAEVAGKHNVSAVAANENGTDMQTWTWNVAQIQETAEVSVLTPAGILALAGLLAVVAACGIRRKR
ncbi:MAG: C1 family peptidase [Euryarchaeota archaeon]|nr:C1 family peptidase [Euryarchaeota archaeon]